MARSDKVPFRREFTLTEQGFAGGESGMFVGDILSLHIDIVNHSSQYYLEGKIGNEGRWSTIDTGQGNEGIDVRAYEYIRVYISDVAGSAKLTIFGYEDNVLQNRVEVIAEPNQLDRDIDNHCLLGDIKKELKILNQYMSIITGDEIK